MRSLQSFQEVTVGGKAKRRLYVVDYFTYLLRNLKSTSEPDQLKLFLHVKEIRAPHVWAENRNA